jgi:hypothetical protein
MKSGKQRRQEIKEKRLDRLAKLADGKHCRLGAVAADHAQLAHNNTYGLLPDFYIDRPFTCRDCGAQELWTAKQQKWWYEIAKGPIDSCAVRCRPCRLMERGRADEARRISSEGLEKKLAAKKLKENND